MTAAGEPNLALAVIGIDTLPAYRGIGPVRIGNHAYQPMVGIINGATRLSRRWESVL